MLRGTGQLDNERDKPWHANRFRKHPQRHWFCNKTCQGKWFGNTRGVKINGAAAKNRQRGAETRRLLLAYIEQFEEDFGRLPTSTEAVEDFGWVFYSAYYKLRERGRIPDLTTSGEKFTKTSLAALRSVPLRGKPAD